MINAMAYRTCICIGRVLIKHCIWRHLCCGRVLSRLHQRRGLLHEALVATPTLGQQVVYYILSESAHWLSSLSHHCYQWLPSQRPLHCCLENVTKVVNVHTYSD